MSPILDDIISTMAKGQALEIVARVGAGADLEAAVRGADVVLMSERVDRTVRPGDFLRRHPDVRLLTLLGGGEQLRVRELVPYEAVIRDVSPADLIALITAGPRPWKEGGP